LNNNRNNNRRRGRGNRSNQGGNNQNRIDSRARGNAPQLLDKYKKLAQDAQHNGDRVQAEYYLQFADHYFRVIADNKARQDEARAKRNEERGGSGDEGDDEDGDNRRRNNRRGRGRRDQHEGDAQEGAATAENSEGESGVEGEPASADEEGAKPKRRARKPKDDGGDEAPRKRTRRKKIEDAGDAAEFDSSILPPAISAASEDDDGLEAVG
jgi:Domain of unknown function (DUF4167)